jgi:hypothetical protein
MWTTLFAGDQLQWLNKEDTKGYLYSFASLLIGETLESWCFPRTTLDIDEHDGPAPHIRTLRKNIDTFLGEHEDGTVWIEWLAELPYADFEKAMRVFVDILEQNFQHSLQKKFPNIDPGVVLYTLGEGMCAALENLADEEEEMVENYLVKRDFIRKFSHHESERMGGSYYIWKCLQHTKAMFGRILQW